MKSLQVMNLAKCQITDAGALHLVYLLLNRYVNLRVLILHWNQIREKGSVALARALRKNNNLQILDVSFNALGTGQPYRKRKYHKKRRQIADTSQMDWVQVAANQLRDSDSESQNERIIQYETPFKCTRSAYKWGQALAENKGLLHLDLSFNSLNMEDIKVIGEQLMHNQTLLGIHLMGN
jgi:Ran GTPase-activating protein (RanGAP) involved in mRNA processing and transport